jgi:hypothetical protein
VTLRPWDTLGGGVALTLILHLVVIALLYVLGAIGASLFPQSFDFFTPALAALFLVGVTQVVYIGPLFVAARRRGYTRLAQGLAIGAGITVLLNAACWGSVALLNA